MPRPPRIHPDYTESTIPPNIAPLNFLVEEPGTHYRVSMHSARGEGIDILSRSPTIAIPLKRWKKLLAANRGEELLWDVYVRKPEGRWSRFKTITNTIAREGIDNYLVYRLMTLIYRHLDEPMVIYQRNLTSYDRSVDGHSQWQWVFETGEASYHLIVPTRGSTVIEQVLGEAEAPPINAVDGINELIRAWDRGTVAEQDAAIREIIAESDRYEHPDLSHYPSKPKGSIEMANKDLKPFFELCREVVEEWASGIYKRRFGKTSERGWVLPFHLQTREGIMTLAVRLRDL